MRRNIRRVEALFAACVIAGVSACGGGGGSGTSISVLPPSLSFDLEQGDDLPRKTVRVTFRGDGVIAGYAPGVTPPAWLNISTSSPVSDSPVDFVIGIDNTSLPPQTRSTNVRFVTGRLDGSDVQYVDLPVAFRLAPSTFQATAQPSALAFASVSGGALPAPKDVMLTLSSGQLASVTPSDNWMTAVRPSPGGNANSIRLQPSTTDFPAGTLLSGTLHVVVQRASGSTRTLLVPYQYDIGRALAVAPERIEYTAIHGSVEPAAPANRSIDIGGDMLNWTAESDQSWLQLASTAGSGETQLAFAIDQAALVPGQHHASIRVSNPAMNQSRTIAVTIDMRPAQLVLESTQVDFTVSARTTASTLQAHEVRVGDELNRERPDLTLRWSVTDTRAPWLQVAPTSGSTYEQPGITLALDSAQLATLGNGRHTTDVSLTYTDAAGTPQTRSIEVRMDLSLPRANVVAPYVGIVGQQQSVVLRGDGFAGISADQVKFGGTSAASIEAINDAEIRVTPPSLQAGWWDISIDNVSDADLSSADLLVLEPTDRPYATFPVTHFTTRLIFDDERETLYAVNRADGQIDRYHFDGRRWLRLESVSIPGLRDLAMQHGGEHLWAITQEEIYEIDLTEIVPTATSRAHFEGDYSADLLYRMALAVSGHAIVTTDSSCCSGSFPTLGYVLGSSDFSQYSRHYSMSDGSPHASADGSVIYVSSSGPVLRYSTASDEIVSTGYRDGVDGVNRDGSLLSSYGAVLNKDFIKVGHISDYGQIVTFGSSADRLYAFRGFASDTAAGRNLLLFDLSATPGADGRYPEAARIPLADEPGVFNGQLSTIDGSPITVSADGRTVFLHGYEKLLMIPVAAP